MKYLHSNNPDASTENVGHEGLAIAIVQSAARDYLVSKRWLMEHPVEEYTSDDWNARRVTHENTVKEVLMFIRSPWFEALIDLDPEKLIEKMDEVVEDERQTLFE